MNNLKTVTNRYADQDLMMFQNLVSQKLEKAKDDLAFLLNQIEELNENKDSEGDWMDNTSTANDLEMLYTMANRHKHHIKDLENTLIRIHNKSFGICVLTGELIDKRRLMAVPTTTKSLVAKKTLAELEVLKSKPSVAAIRKTNERKVITKIISAAKGQLPVDNINSMDDLADDEFEMDFSEIDTVE